jgi:tetratricopeptide (TPR) repeat protein
LSHARRLVEGQRQDRLRVELTLRLAQALYFLGSYHESVECLLPEDERVAGLDEAGLAGQYHFWLSHMFTRLNDHTRAVESAHRAIAEAECCGDGATMGKAYGVLAVEAYWAGEGLRGVELGQRGVALLEATGEQWWLGMGLFYLGINHLLIGEFEEALAAETRVRAIGEAIGDSRLQSTSCHVIGLAHAMRGNATAAVEACQRSLSLAPDPVSRIFAMAALGCAYVEQADPARAIPLLEEVCEVLGRFRALQWQAWFLTVLAEAHRLAGASDRARTLSARGLEVARAAGNSFAVGWAQRTMGRIARSRSIFPAAEAHLAEALETFGSITARFEAARTHLDLAELTATRGGLDAAAAHLKQARGIFTSLRVSTYVERTAACATALGLPLGLG